MDGPKIRRLYYLSRDVTRICGIPGYTLRRWETAFPQLKPIRSKSGRRLYQSGDLDIIQRIKNWKSAGYTDYKIQFLLDLSERDDGNEMVMDGYGGEDRKKSLQSLLDELRVNLLDILDIINRPENR